VPFLWERCNSPICASVTRFDHAAMHHLMTKNAGLPLSACFQHYLPVIQSNANACAGHASKRHASLTRKVKAGTTRTKHRHNSSYM
jgi:hypothetical protein